MLEVDMTENSVRYTGKSPIPIPIGDVFRFQAQMSQNLNKKFVKSNYARYLKF